MSQNWGYVLKQNLCELLLSILSPNQAPARFWPAALLLTSCRNMSTRSATRISRLAGEAASGAAAALGGLVLWSDSYRSLHTASEASNSLDGHFFGISDLNYIYIPTFQGTFVSENMTLFVKETKSRL